MSRRRNPPSRRRNGGLRLRLQPTLQNLPAHLPAMAQEMIREHAGHHGFADRHHADADAGSWRLVEYWKMTARFDADEYEIR